MLSHLHGGRADGTYERRLLTYTRPDLLVLDDFGLKPLVPPAPEDFYDVINERYERGAVIITSNARSLNGQICSTVRCWRPPRWIAWRTTPTSSRSPATRSGRRGDGGPPRKRTKRKEATAPEPPPVEPMAGAQTAPATDSTGLLDLHLSSDQPSGPAALTGPRWCKRLAPYARKLTPGSTDQRKDTRSFVARVRPGAGQRPLSFSQS